LTFVDTSAVVAILSGEAEAGRFLDLLAQENRTITAPHVRLESSMILARNLGLGVDDAEQLFDDFLLEAKIDMVAITDEIGRKAVHAFARFGKGRGHPAQLNFGDCLSYACAAAHDAPILFKGDDFLHTDLEAAAP
jgi:ribonuclease VapC